MISFEGGTIMNGEDFKRLEQIIVNFKEDVKAELRHQIGIQSEHFQHSIDAVPTFHCLVSRSVI